MRCDEMVGTIQLAVGGNALNSRGRYIICNNGFDTTNFLGISYGS